MTVKIDGYLEEFGLTAEEFGITEQSLLSCAGKAPGGERRHVEEMKAAIKEKHP